MIFDCDGTLVDSEHLNTHGLCLKLGEQDIELSTDDLVERFRGQKLELILKQLEREHKVQLGDMFVHEYRNLVNHLFEKHLQECDGVSSMLEKVTKPMCIASGAPMQKIKKALSVTGLSDYFNANIFSSHDINSWKPDPGIFLHAARSMNTEPVNCAVVEDSLVGIQAAKSAAMTPILYDPKENYTDMKGVFIIRQMNELNALIV